MDRLEDAIRAYQDALTEHRNADTLKRLNDTEKGIKTRAEQAYLSPEIAEQEREKGNQCFKDQNYPDAVKHYSEAIKRNPTDYRLYSNRAACYTKLTAFYEALKDAEKCIELNPQFAKGYGFFFLPPSLSLSFCFGCLNGFICDLIHVRQVLSKGPRSIFHERV